MQPSQEIGDKWRQVQWGEEERYIRPAHQGLLEEDVDIILSQNAKEAKLLKGRDHLMSEPMRITYISVVIWTLKALFQR